MVTDRIELLALYKTARTPVVMLCPPDQAENRVDGFDVGGEQVISRIDDAQLLSSIKSACGEFSKSLPLVEPFERIRLAIEEAQAVAR